MTLGRTLLHSLLLLLSLLSLHSRLPICLGMMLCLKVCHLSLCHLRRSIDHGLLLSCRLRLHVATLHLSELLGIHGLRDTVCHLTLHYCGLHHLRGWCCHTAMGTGLCHVLRGCPLPDDGSCVPSSRCPVCHLWCAIPARLALVARNPCHGCDWVGMLYSRAWSSWRSMTLLGGGDGHGLPSLTSRSDDG